MLVVNWGQRNPVIYSCVQRTISGEWADGSAAEKLVPFARAASSSVRSPEGSYASPAAIPTAPATPARSPSRGRQSLSVRLAGRPQSYRGDGTLDGNVLVVNWGSATPVIYSLAADGILSGLWSAGRGAEVLTPVAGVIDVGVE